MRRRIAINAKVIGLVDLTTVEVEAKAAGVVTVVAKEEVEEVRA